MGIMHRFIADVGVKDVQLQQIISHWNTLSYLISAVYLTCSTLNFEYQSIVKKFTLNWYDLQLQFKKTSIRLALDIPVLYI